VKLVLFSILISYTFFASAQTRDTFAWSPPGATWIYSASGWQIQYFWKLKYEGDTIYNGLLVKKLNLYQVDYYPIGPNWNRSREALKRSDLFYQSNDTVYWLQQNGFEPLYIFSAQVGDSWPIYETDAYYYYPHTQPLDTVDTVRVSSLGAYTCQTPPTNYQYDLVNVQYNPNWNISRFIRNIGGLNVPYPVPNYLGWDTSIIDGGPDLPQELYCYYDSLRDYRFFSTQNDDFPCWALVYDYDRAISVDEYQPNLPPLRCVYKPNAQQLALIFPQEWEIFPVRVHIYNSLGQLWGQHSLNQSADVDISALPQGFYTAQLRWGSHSHAFPFIKL